MDKQLAKAVKVVSQLGEWFDKVVPYEAQPQRRPVPNLAWSPTTLAVLVDEVCVWEDQTDTDENLTFRYCLGTYREQIETLHRFVQADR